MSSSMTKTQVYFPKAELATLHKVARKRKQPVAALVREAVRLVWLREPRRGPVALWDGPFGGSATDHDSAFDEV